MAAAASSFGSRISAPFRRYFAVVRDPEQGWPKRVGYVLGGLFVLGASAFFALVLYALVLIPTTPSAAELRRDTAARPAIVLSADGQEIAQFERFNRVWLPLDSIATHVVDALIATEDRRFYDHGGLDVRRFVTAAFLTATGDRQGGSTITQQLARNLYPEEIGREFSITRKLKELITAVKIERAYEKDQILEAYLNTVPFLYNAYGVELAARTYFGKHADELTEVEAATLIGMLKGTSYYNPVRNPERALERRNLVLGQMVRHGVLTEAARDSLREQPLGIEFERQEGPASRAPHFTRYVREWLTTWADQHGYDLFADGLVIHTTLDMRLQEMAEAAVREQGAGLQAVADVEWSRASMPSLSGGFAAYERYRDGVTPFEYFWNTRPDFVERAVRRSQAFRAGVEQGLAEAALYDSLRADAAFMDSLRTAATRLEVGLVAVEPRTGHLKAWVGSRDYDVTAFDHVYQARRQAGSTFKPFVYAAALQRGWLPGDVFPDERVEIPLDNGRRVWRPANAGGGYSGQPLTLTEGLVYSKNTITAQLMMEVGPAYVASLARDLGVTESDLDVVPSLALGTSDVTLLEMAAAYAAIANRGRSRRPVPVTRVETSAGRVLAEFGSESRRALSENTAEVLVHMMRGVIDRGTGVRIRNQFGITADVAGKTGTTQNNADGWFLLMHPSLVVGAWVGFQEPAVAFRSSYWGQGSHNALLVVGDFFRDAQAVIPDDRFATPVRYQEPGSIFERAGRWVRSQWDDEAYYDSLYAADSLYYSGYSYDYEADSSFYSEFEYEDDLFEDGEAAEADELEEEARAGEDEGGRTAVQRLYERAGEEPPPEVGRGAPDPAPVEQDAPAEDGGGPVPGDPAPGAD